MKVEMSRRALREMRRIDAYWKANATHTGVFLDELEELIEHIEGTSVLGPVYEARASRPVYRRLLERSGYHVYMAKKSEDVVVIVSIWSARRRRGPKL